MLRRSNRSTVTTNLYEPEEWPHRKSFTAEQASKIRRYQGNKCNCGCGKYITHENSQIDHIREIADGGGNERSNLQALYTICHQRKTSRNRKYRSERKRKRKEEEQSNSNDNLFTIGSECDLRGDLRGVVLLKNFKHFGNYYGLVTDYSPCGDSNKFTITWTDSVSGEEYPSEIYTRSEISKCKVF